VITGDARSGTIDGAREREATERKWSRDFSTPGEEHMVGLLNDFRASWALIRQWVAHEAALGRVPKFLTSSFPEILASSR
jgi:hypothetical protein